MLKQRANCWVLVSIFIAVLVVFAVFLKSYFPSKKAIEGHADFYPFPGSLESSVDTSRNVDRLNPLYGRLVFILIDALRRDFVISKDSPMVFISEKIKQQSGRIFTAKAHPPTVTLPRIKALTTGGIPGFVDVVLNFGSSSLQEDNLITQMKRHKRRLVFYGDDTWLRLFPDHFIRSDGTTSFFVTDYTEVDDNVTRHLIPEMREADFDTLILHYLGLDHIGHLAGPKSPLVKPKLQEMDQIVRDIFNFSEQYKDTLPSLIMVCGDHGMSDQGSHGGASTSETLVPVVFLSPQKQFTYNFRKDDIKLFKTTEIDQIDVVPTLSLLLGLPIPQNNLGKLIDGMLDGYTLEQKVLAWHTNAYQVLQVFKQNVPNFQQDPAFLAYERTSKSHHDWLFQINGNLSSVVYRDIGIRISQQYKAAIVSMTAKISSSLTQYDMYGLIVSIIALFIILIILTLYTSQISLSLHWFSFSFILIGVLICHMTVCTSQSARASSLCRWETESVLLQCGLICIFVWFANCFVCCIKHFYARNQNIKIEPRDFAPFCLVFGTVLHTLSLGSSSFVEEEHQTWYFFTITIHFVLIYKTINCYCKQYSQTGKIKTVKKCTDQTQWKNVKEEMSLKNTQHELYSEYETAKEVENLKSDDFRSRCEVVNNIQDVTPRLRSVPNDRERNKIFCRNTVLGCVAVLVLCRILRSWNQTGNKWLDTPDVGDWLVRPENKTTLSIFVVLSMLVILMKQSRHMVFYQRLLILTSLMCTYWYRAVTGVLQLPFITENVSKGVTEARLGFTTITVFILQNIIQILKNKLMKDKCLNLSVDFVLTLHKSWILIMVLLVRPHNIPMVAMVATQEHIISEYVFKEMWLSVPGLTLYYLWMGQASFFYQGNSNSISTVDVSAGYIGLDDYQPFVVGILLTLSTYAGTIFWLLSLVKIIMKSYSSYTDSSLTRLTPAIIEASHTLALSRVLPLSFYTVVVTLQRYHLFVWTVFSPKLLYEGMTTVVISLFCILMLMTNL